MGVPEPGDALPPGRRAAVSAARSGGTEAAGATRPAPFPLARGPAGPGPVRSVYVHAPFCARRCPYCDFAVTVDGAPPVGRWLRALAAEREALEAEGRFPVADRLDTLYVGGGTPSVLGPGAMEGLADVIGAGRLASPDLEWTAEANPESLTADVARAWRRAGVTRLSVGVQSFHAPALRWLGRLHGPEDARRTVEEARRAGFDDLSVDLIFGLPERLDRSWSRDLDEALRLDVPHVSLYGLSVESATALGRAVARGREEEVDEERFRAEFLEAARRLTGEGYVHYEVTSFARPGHGSRHNQVYWTGAPYLGLGSSAHSYRHPLRRWNIRDWAEYEQEVDRGRVPVVEEEILDEADHRLERVWLALRTRRGLDRSGLPPEAERRVREWIRAGWAADDPGAIRLTPEGWLLLDRLSVELDARLDAFPQTSGS